MSEILVGRFDWLPRSPKRVIHPSFCSITDRASDLKVDLPTSKLNSVEGSLGSAAAAQSTGNINAARQDRIEAEGVRFGSLECAFEGGLLSVVPDHRIIPPANKDMAGTGSWTDAYRDPYGRQTLFQSSHPSIRPLK